MTSVSLWLILESPCLCRLIFTLFMIIRDIGLFCRLTFIHLMIIRDSGLHILTALNSQ